MPTNHLACVCLVVGVTFAPSASWASGQQAPSQQAPPEPASGSVRVPARGANVHMGPTTGQQLLVVVPKGTVLKVTGRDKEWIQVELPAELRKTSMVMRWYQNETRGWMHDSTVEFLEPKSPRVAPR
jgi:uncharacterized protein YgiM (DUF1202 family)